MSRQAFPWLAGHRNALSEHASADTANCRAGYPEYELRAGGADLAVGAGNVAEYVEAVTHATLREGIQAQIVAFRCAIRVVLTYAC